LSLPARFTLTLLYLTVQLASSTASLVARRPTPSAADFHFFQHFRALFHLSPPPSRIINSHPIVGLKLRELSLFDALLLWHIL
jgi:hypothetical protein